MPKVSPTEDLAAEGDVSEVDTTEDASPTANSETTLNEEEAAQSSGADDPDDKRETLLDAVKKAAGEDSQEESSPSGQEQESSSEDEEEGDKPGEQEAAEQSSENEGEEDTRFDKHPRFQKLLKENKDLKAPAEQYRKIEEFMTQNDLTPDEVADGFVIMSLIKQGRADEAMQRLSPILENLQTAVGQKLPEDLQKKVDDGYMDEESAKEVAQLRHQSRVSQTQAERRQQEMEAQRQNQTVQGIRSSVAEWERSVRQTDPDYDRKSRLITMAARELVLERGQPRNEAEALSLAKDAYALANEEAKRLSPPKQPTQRRPSGSASSTQAAAQPASLYEVVKQAAVGGA